jgi:hypothetical protein
VLLPEFANSGHLDYIYYENYQFRKPALKEIIIMASNAG